MEEFVLCPWLFSCMLGLVGFFGGWGDPFSLDKNNSIHVTFQISNKNGEQFTNGKKRHETKNLGTQIEEVNSFQTKLLHPPKQTWNLKMDPWKRRFLLETIISRFHVSFWGCRFRFLMFQEIVQVYLCLCLFGKFLHLRFAKSFFDRWQNDPNRNIRR